MIRIGLVDLDTSHAGFFVPLLHRADDIRVTAVFDGGSTMRFEDELVTMRDSAFQAMSRFFREGVPAVPVTESLEVARILLAAAESRRTGRRIALADIPAEAGFDGAAYTRDFARLGACQGDGLAARSVYAS